MSQAPKRPKGEPLTSSAGGGKKFKAPQISVDTYNKMYEAWCDRQSVQHVMDMALVNRVTATRYLDKGDPERKLPAIRARWERTQQQAQAAEDYNIIKARREVQTAARIFLARIAQRIARLDPDELDANKVVSQLQCTQAVIERTLGIADATVSIQGQDRFASWTAEELLEFAKSGTTPEHSRGGDEAAAAASKKRKGAE